MIDMNDANIAYVIAAYGFAFAVLAALGIATWVQYRRLRPHMGKRP